MKSPPVTLPLGKTSVVITALRRNEGVLYLYYDFLTGPRKGTSFAMVLDIWSKDFIDKTMACNRLSAIFAATHTSMPLTQDNIATHALIGKQFMVDVEPTIVAILNTRAEYPKRADLLEGIDA